MNKIEKAIKMTQALECELRDVEMCSKALEQLERHADISIGDVCIVGSQEYDQDIKISELEKAEITVTIARILREHRNQCVRRIDELIETKGAGYTAEQKNVVYPAGHRPKSRPGSGPISPDDVDL